MANPAEMKAMICFFLNQMSVQNKHHDFEHLCRHIARARICKNILPATGPVGCGGDQGRDFETYRTYIKELFSEKIFFGQVSEKTLVFGCSLQRNICSKIKSDVNKIMMEGTERIEIHYFCVENVNISKRHKLKKWVKEKYNTNFELYDGQAISEYLCDKDLEWLISHYLEVPEELIQFISNKNFAHRKVMFFDAGPKINCYQKDFQSYRDDFKEMTTPLIGSEGSFQFRKKRVILNGYMPHFPKLHGCCSITFLSSEISGCTMDFEHKRIIGDLFDNVFSTLMNRRFLRKTLDDDGFFVNFPNITFKLNKEEAEQLCEAIDCFAKEYLARLERIEKEIGSSDLVPAKRNGYRLAKITKSLWNDMIDFANNSGSDVDSKWDIFETNYAMIKLHTKKDTNTQNSGYHAILGIEQVEKDSLSLVFADEQVWVVWNPFQLYCSSIKDFDGRHLWDGDTLQKWLVSEFVPAVESYKKYINNNYTEDLLSGCMVKTLSAENIRTVEELLFVLGTIKSLQSYEKIEISNKEIFSIYESFKMCLLHSTFRDFHYISKHLGCNECSNLKTVLDFIDNMKNDFKREKCLATFSPLLIIMTFCLSETSYLTNKEISFIAESMNPLVNFYNKTLMLNKYAKI